jgi:acyl-CoA synthetase (AMP-forming)/AMP-acid ligase II
LREKPQIVSAEAAAEAQVPEENPAIDPAENYVHHALRLFPTFGDHEALVSSDGRRFTFADMTARIRNTAAALWDNGIRPGMTLALLVTNPPESYFIQFGAHLLGCRTVWMSHSTPKAFLDEVVGFVGADAFIYEVEHMDELGRELGLAAALPVFCIGAGGLGPDLVDPPDVTELPFDPDAITTAPVSLFQTSGTTGTPKLVEHGNRFFRSITRVAEYYRPTDGRRIRHLLISATWHAGAQSAALMTWFDGGTLVQNFGWDTATFLATLANERITSSMLSPPLLYLMLDHEDLASTDTSAMQNLTISASAATPARLTQAIKRFGSAVNIVYGMCEMTIITALDPLEDHPDLLAACGTPWGDARVEIRDRTGARLPAGEIGEIWVTGTLRTDGYWGQPELTAQTLVDGWLQTGDVGRLDADGNLFIVDRLKDMILTDLGSTNVFSRPLEDTLAEHPEVRHAAVIGVPDEALGEAVYAYVIRTPGASVTEEELRQLVVDRLNTQWSPREVEFIDAFPLTEYGKVDKKQLRARYLAEHPKPEHSKP